MPLSSSAPVDIGSQQNTVATNSAGQRNRFFIDSRAEVLHLRVHVLREWPLECKPFGASRYIL